MHGFKSDTLSVPIRRDCTADHVKEILGPLYRWRVFLMFTEQLDINVEHVNIQYGVFLVCFSHKEKQKGLPCLWAVVQDCGTSGGPGLDRPVAAPAG